MSDVQKTAWRGKTCVWERDSIYDADLGVLTVVFAPKCTEFLDAGYPHCKKLQGTYCPYCGGRIEIIDGGKDET